MALSIADINAVTKIKYVPKMVDNIFDSDPLLARAKKKFSVKLDGGSTIRQPLAYASTSASGWYTGSDTLDTTDNSVFTAAEYEWKQLYANIPITGRDKMVNKGAEQVLNFVKEKVKQAERTIKDTLSTGLYSDGSDSNAIVGLRDIAAADQTVGNISQSTYSWWQAQVNSSTTTLTLDALQTEYNNASINNDHPTVIMATRSLYNSYYALLQPQQRFMDSETAKGGFSSLMFNGVPFIAGAKVPSNHLFMLNENYLHLYVHRERDFKFEEFERVQNQDIELARILWMGALGSSNNRMHVKFSGLTA
jgi:hypothetical protein